MIEKSILIEKVTDKQPDITYHLGTYTIDKKMDILITIKKAVEIEQKQRILKMRE